MRKPTDRLPAKARWTSPLARSSRLGIELLEDRQLLAASFNPGQVIVQFKAGVSDDVKAVVRQELSAVRHDFLRVGLGGPELVSFAGSRSVEQVVERLRQNPAVAFAEPNWVLTKQAFANDTYYTNGSLWGTYSSDQPAVGPAGTTSVYGSQAEKVWAAGNTGSKGVYVGVIDEGIDYRHPDLQANIWLNPYDPVDGVDNDGNGYADDTHGWDFYQNDNSIYDGGNNDVDAHGTHVAGTIGGVGGNGSGVAGMSWDVTIISGKFLGPNGGDIASAVRAVNYFTNLKVRHGLNIVALNNSWGGGGYSQAMHEAIIRAAKQDILFIAAAGNGNFLGQAINNDASPQYPSSYDTTVGTPNESAASYDNVIAVAAIDSNGNKASWSNYGATTVDLGAPGVGIWSTTPNGGYQSYNGTSMATPHVTGAVALYAAAHPDASALQIRTALLDAARNTPTASMAGKTTTGGRLNVSGFATAPGITVRPTTGLATTEAGETASVAVVLNSRPAADVMIGLSTSDDTEGVLSASQLVFSPANWDVAQTVTVTGVDDAVADGPQAYRVITAAAVSTDPAYHGLDADDVAVVNVDNDTPGFVLSRTSGLRTTEAGGSDTFTVALASRPADGEVVTVYLTSTNAGEGTVAPAGLTFDQTNWSTPQTVTVTGVDDWVVDGSATYAVRLRGASNLTDSAYNAAAAEVTAMNADDDKAGIVVTPTSGLTTTEAGGTASFTVVLTSRPAADVTVGLSSSDTTEGTVSPSLTFTRDNWDKPQTVVVTGVQDGTRIVDGDRPYAVVTAKATSGDANYNGMDAADVSLVNKDVDTVATTKTFASYDSGPIRDWAKSGSQLVISPSNNLKITDLNVSVNLTHDYIGDLIVTLKSPAGNTVTLFNRRGGSNKNLAVTFDDEASRAISNYTSTVSTYRPEKPLSAFDNQNSAGTWWLYVEDRSANGRQGSVNAWSLTFNTPTGSTGTTSPILTIGLGGPSSTAARSASTVDLASALPSSKGQLAPSGVVSAGDQEFPSTGAGSRDDVTVSVDARAMDAAFGLLGMRPGRRVGQWGDELGLLDLALDVDESLRVA